MFTDGTTAASTLRGLFRYTATFFDTISADDLRTLKRPVDASKPLPRHYSQWQTQVPNFFSIS